MTEATNFPISSAPRSVVITGGTQGLGFGYAREFLGRRWNVAICGRSESGVRAALARLAPHAPADARLRGRACDTSDMQQVEALWAEAAGQFGRIDLWLNNAGHARIGPTFLETEAGDIDAMLRSNVIGTMNACQVAFAGMKSQGGGRIYVTLGGGAASGRVLPGMAVYSTTKRALTYFVRAMAKEAEGSGVLIGAVSPGVNLTEGFMREFTVLPQDRRLRAMRRLNFVADDVETTVPWLVDRMLADAKQGSFITWLTAGRLLRRGVSALAGRRRDVLSRRGAPS